MKTGRKEKYRYESGMKTGRKEKYRYESGIGR